MPALETFRLQIHRENDMPIIIDTDKNLKIGTYAHDALTLRHCDMYFFEFKPDHSILLVYEKKILEDEMIGALEINGLVNTVGLDPQGMIIAGIGLDIKVLKRYEIAQ